MLLPARCPLCHRPVRTPPCPGCITALPAVTGPPPSAVLVLFAFAGAGRELLAALKYRNGRSVVPWLGASLARLVAGQRVDVVTWAPTHAERRRRRGYDQAELLAGALGRALEVPCRPLLRRTDRAGPQTRLGRADRLVAPVFAATSVVEGRVVVVDDVVTTGATLAAASVALSAAGAAGVVRVAAAATPGDGRSLAAAHGRGHRGSPPTLAARRA